jgi:hypothetical protein
MGLLIVICGMLASLVGAAGYFIPAIRNAEDLLPDHVATSDPAPTAGEQQAVVVNE